MVFLFLKRVILFIKRKQFTKTTNQSTALARIFPQFGHNAISSGKMWDGAYQQKAERVPFLCCQEMPRR